MTSDKPKLKLVMRNRSGQVLVLVLLIVVVTLAVALSVASRNITNLRTSTQTEHSQRAFTAAEGGVEEVLSRLSTIAATESSVNTATGYLTTVNFGDVESNVVVKGSNVYEALIDEGTVGQVTLESTAAGVSAIQVEWAKISDPAESDKPASIEITQVFEDPVGSGTYRQTREAFSGGSFPERDEKGLNLANCVPNPEFRLCAQVTREDDPLFMRIRPFWNRTSVRVSGVGGSLPVQTYDIVSTASTDLGVTRRVQVQRTVLPQLPAAFDYVLFSHGDLEK